MYLKFLKSSTRTFFWSPFTFFFFFVVKRIGSQKWLYKTIVIMYQSCQLNALLTALTQTKFNGVKIFIARLMQLFFLWLKTKKQQPDCYVQMTFVQSSRLIALQALFLYRPVLISVYGNVVINKKSFAQGKPMHFTMLIRELK